jgi:hypothetical protein
LSLKFIAIFFQSSQRLSDNRFSISMMKLILNYLMIFSNLFLKHEENGNK